jgi:hypothetical protein
MSTVLGIDPGLATGGMVLLEVEPERVLKVQRLKTKPGEGESVAGEKQFSQAVARGRIQVAQMREFLIETEPDFISIESFVDLASRKGKQDRKRWTTPLVIGMLDSCLQDLGMEDKVRYQNPSVLFQFRVEINQIAEANRKRGRSDSLVLGDKLLSNEHLISAWAHASWRAARL